MRGARSFCQPCQHPRRIIPAYAGSTLAINRYHTVLQDHPRVCGEHAPSLLYAADDVGSSPRMRGAPGKTIVMTAWLGIIPAYAGSTGFCHCKGNSRRDHPRVCGEHRELRINITCSLGSSPRMRGALRFILLSCMIGGIIPAYAGSTHNPSRILVLSRDHPRVCGEHTIASHLPRLARGSSPRMRGAR